MCEAQGRVAGDDPPSVENCGNAVGGDADLSGQRSRAHAGFGEFFHQMFAWMNSPHGQDPPSDNRQSPRLSALEMSLTIRNISVTAHLCGCCTDLARATLEARLPEKPPLPR